MKTLFAVWACAKADFLDRARRFSFLAISALTVLATFWFVPKPTGFTALVIEPDSVLQASDASWVPMSAAMCGGMLLCLIGFAYIRSAVRLDRDTGVLCLLRASPTGRFAYLLGKLLSNFLLLFILLAAEAVGAFLMMLIQYPGQFPSPYSFLTPFLAVLPGLVFVSAAALFAECVPFFSRGTGSGLAAALFFCLSVTILSLAAMDINPYRLTSVFDFSGYLWLRDSISASVLSVTGKPAVQIQVFSDVHTSGAGLKAVAFHGLLPSARFLTDKLLLIVFSVLLTAVSSLLLPRREKTVPVKEKKESEPRKKSAEPACRRRYIPVPASGGTVSGLVVPEMRMMLSERPVLWKIAALGLWISSIFSPLDTVRGTLLPIAFGWMLPVFSQMGCREHRNGMDSLFRTVEGAPLRQAKACWRAGFAVSIVTALPLMLRMLASGQETGFLACFVFVLFVPSAALFFGEWTNTGRAFEIVFLVLCYLMLNVPDLAIPLEPEPTSFFHIAVFALFAAGALILSFGKRAAAQKSYLRPTRQ